jgi:hypothetical protein
MQEESKDCKICTWVNVEDTWIGLAHHILQNKFTHQSGLKWASTFQLKFAKYEIKKPDFEGRLPYTEEQKEARESCVRHTTGQTNRVPCRCPSCKSEYYRDVEIEFLNDNGVWRIGKQPAIVCDFCRRTKGEKKW